MRVEGHFIDRSDYPKVPSETSTPIDAVEWFAKNKGITNLDDPSVKVRTIINDVNESELARHEAKKAREAKAQDEFLDAMFNLDNGTAVHRQESDKNKVLRKAKAIRETQPEAAKEVATPAKPVAKVAEKISKPIKALNAAQIASRKKRQKNQIRRDGITKILKEGGAIQPIDWRGKSLPAHQAQSNDLMIIGKKEGLNIVRVNKVGTRDMSFITDNFERCNIAKPISCAITGPDSAKLFEIIRNGQMITVDDIQENVIAGSRFMTYLAGAYGIEIYSVVKSNKTVGWVLASAANPSHLEIEARKSEVSDLGDMLQAIDYLRVRKEVANRMPDATPDEILEAAYREFKRVAKDAGSTISEVLAVKESQ